MLLLKAEEMRFYIFKNFRKLQSNGVHLNFVQFSFITLYTFEVYIKRFICLIFASENMFNYDKSNIRDQKFVYIENGVKKIELLNLFNLIFNFV